MSSPCAQFSAFRLTMMADSGCAPGVFGYGYWFSNGVPMADA
ncbi:hypothetical protein [Halomonas sp. HL-93]|nr:hypothetical protein [Halomonas sp. HL-93]SBR51327.1 hypothetical protein GA0071314_3138 [Halomonas sp. HL-93]